MIGSVPSEAADLPARGKFHDARGADGAGMLLVDQDERFALDEPVHPFPVAVGDIGRKNRAT